MKKYMFLPIVLLLLSTWASAAVLTVTWLPNPPEDGVTDYILCYGYQSRSTAGFTSYTYEVDAGNVTTFPTIDLDITRPIYFAVISADAAGYRSDYSPEYAFTNEIQPDTDITRVKGSTLFVQIKQNYTNGQAFDLTDSPKGVQSYKFYVATTAAADVATATPTIVPKTLKTTCRKNLPAGNTVYWAYRVVFNDNTESELSPIAFWLKGYPFAAVDYTTAVVDGRAAIKYGASGCFGNYYSDIDLRPELCSDITGVDLILQPAPLCSAFDMDADGYVGPVDQINWAAKAFGQATH